MGVLSSCICSTHVSVGAVKGIPIRPLAQWGKDLTYYLTPFICLVKWDMHYQGSACRGTDLPPGRLLYMHTTYNASTYIIMMMLMIMIMIMIRGFCPRKAFHYKRSSAEGRSSTTKLRNPGWSFTRDWICAVTSLCFPHPTLSLASEQTSKDLKRSHGHQVVVRGEDLANWPLQTLPKFTTGVKYRSIRIFTRTEIWKKYYNKLQIIY